VATRLRRFLAVLIPLGLLLSLSSNVLATAEADAFQRTWQRTDYPVATGQVSRTWMWGPMEFARNKTEPYEQSPGGQRQVMYFDKSRMEINNPRGDSNSQWYVTNGLLANELMTGQMQTGDNRFESHQPAQINVAGDPNDPNGPTYVTFAGLRDEPPYPQGHVITSRVNRAGQVSDDPSLATHGVTAEHRVNVPGIDHRVASVFWDFMNSSGTVWENGAYRHARLFPNPFYETGYPTTEAYWAKVLVGGVERDVLMQCFERRCLTYTPSNPNGWKVEAGNIGLHYFRWRYGDAEADREMVSVTLVSPSDGGPVGCQDSIHSVQREIEATRDAATRARRALESLFAIEDQWYGESGLYNALYQSDLTVDSVTVANNTATVHLSGQIRYGGVCDEPRVKAQIVYTVRNAARVDNVVVTVNGQPLHPENYNP
jgi:hypothetical protein